MTIAVLPARGGSKRIPRKNVRQFCGKPIIDWAISAALESRCFDSIIVSTDDEEIVERAQNLGVMAPFLRPAELANDYATTSAVMRHAVTWAEENLNAQSAYCCIYPTAAFLEAADLRKAREILDSDELDYVIPIALFSYPIQRALRLTDSKNISMFHPKNFQSRSQDLEPAYHDAGQFYFGSTVAWLEERPLFDARSRGMVLPRSRVQDIDTLEDWDIAEALFRLRGKG